MIEELAHSVIELGTKRGTVIATAESCTGGLIAGALTEIPGSSAVVDRGFVTYSNQAKMEMLGVSPVDLETHGAVSAVVARAMVSGALENSDANLAIAVTGIAGPGGGTEEKPVGLVFIAVQTKGKPAIVRECRFSPADRSAIRRQTVETALTMALNLIG